MKQNIAGLVISFHETVCPCDLERRNTMQVTDILNGKFPSVTKYATNATNTTQSGVGFDMFLAEAGQRQTFEPAVENQSRSRDDGRGSGNRRTEESRASREEQPTRRREARTDDTESTVGTAMVQETTQTEAANCNETVIDEEKAVAKIAAILQIPEEVVVELLQELDMTAQDLIDPKAVAKMLQQTLGAENPLELLTNPEFPEFYKAINEAMAGLVVEAKTSTTKSIKTADVKVDTEAINALVEGLEATLEDGEIVVTADKDAFANANNARQQSATVTTTETTAQQAVQTQAGDVELTDKSMFVADEIVVDNTVAPVVNVETTAVKVEQAIIKQTASQQPVNATDVIEQIMSQVKLTSAGGQFTEIKMTLRPESLGDIVLRVLTHNGIVTAQFEAESQRVKEALEADFNMLRDALEEQGIKFSELSVSVRQDEDEKMNQFERARQKSRHRAESIEDVSEEAEISYHNGVIDVTA
jgi:flagellar hook-length control protein FliK